PPRASWLRWPNAPCSILASTPKRTCRRTESRMLVRLERRPPPAAAPASLLEVITPRTNEASLTSSENLLAAIALAEPFALEIAADHQARRFLVRAATDAMLQHLQGQLGATYPQSVLRPLDVDADPARVAPHE